MDPRLTEYTAPDGQKIRAFHDAVIQDAIDRALSRANLTSPLVAVAHVEGTAEGARASVSLLVRRGDHWSVAAACVKATDRTLAYGAEVVWTP